MRTSTARVISSVSAVPADQPWAFFAIAGTEWGAPRWVYLDDDHPERVIDLDAIATCLRRHLGPDTQSHPLDQEAGDLVNSFIQRLTRAERSLLPRKKRRALDQMAVVLQRYSKRAAEHCDAVLVELCEETRRLAQPHSTDDRSVDYRALADCWLTLITPLWVQRLREVRKRRSVRLGDLTRDLQKVENEITTRELQAVFDGATLYVAPLDRRIVSTFVGVT